MNPVFLFSLVGLLAWPLRGQFGGLEGALIAGMFFGVAAVFLTPSLSDQAVAWTILLTSLCFMPGGEISYGKEFFTMSQLNSISVLLKPWAILVGIGTFWGAVGGLGLGVGLSVGKDAKIIVKSVLLGAAGMGLGFLISAGCLQIAARLSEQPFLAEIFKLRDQMIGITTGIFLSRTVSTFPQNPGNYSHSKKITAATLFTCILIAFQNVFEKWLTIDFLDPLFFSISLIVFALLIALLFNSLFERHALRTALFKSGATILPIFVFLAISKEALPNWPQKWEWSYTLMLVTCGILLKGMSGKSLSCYESSA